MTEGDHILEQLDQVLRHTILDADHNVIPADLMTWARWFEDFDNRRVASDYVGEIHVSTVFLGIDHNFGYSGPPLWFETMVFAPEHADEETERYTTWDEALKGHAEILARVRARVPA